MEILTNDKNTTLNGMIGFQTSENEKQPIYIIIKYEKVTYEPIKYKYLRVKLCKKIVKRRCHYKTVRVPYTLTSYDHDAIRSGILKMIYEKVYHEILKTIQP